jgi:hypothetical protein
LTTVASVVRAARASSLPKVSVPPPDARAPGDRSPATELDDLLLDGHRAEQPVNPLGAESFDTPQRRSFRVVRPARSRVELG